MEKGSDTVHVFKTASMIFTTRIKLLHEIIRMDQNNFEVFGTHDSIRVKWKDDFFIIMIKNYIITKMIARTQ